MNKHLLNYLSILKQSNNWYIIILYLTYEYGRVETLAFHFIFFKGFIYESIQLAKRPMIPFRKPQILLTKNEFV